LFFNLWHSKNICSVGVGLAIYLPSCVIKFRLFSCFIYTARPRLRNIAQVSYFLGYKLQKIAAYIANFSDILDNPYYADLDVNAVLCSGVIWTL